MDGMLRSSPQGYCLLPLAPHCPGSATHTLQAWRPALTPQQRVSEFFLGGAPELQSVAFVGYPASGPPEYVAGRTPLVKLATASEGAGWLRVRTHCALQYSDPCAAPLCRLCSCGRTAPPRAVPQRSRRLCCVRSLSVGWRPLLPGAPFQQGDAVICDGCMVA